MRAMVRAKLNIFNQLTHNYIKNDGAKNDGLQQNNTVYVTKIFQKKFGNKIFEKNTTKF